MLSGAGPIQVGYDGKGCVIRSDYATTSATFSICETWRYVLWRRWIPVDTDPRVFVVVGLNPSTADEMQNDPTITRCINFAKREGFPAFCMLNLFAFRATDPKAMKVASDPVGPRNDWYMRDLIESAHEYGGKVVAAWGAHGGYQDRDVGVLKSVIPATVPVWCFGQTKQGKPKHPLYLRNDTPLEPYTL